MRTSRISASFIDATGSRSNDTPWKRFGSRPATAAARLRAIRAGRHEHGRARRRVVIEDEAGAVAAVVGAGAQ